MTYVISFPFFVQDANPDNLTIEISRNSTYKTVADSLCSLAMYSDFLAATSDTSISFKLQALQSILEQNVKDGCNVLKNQSLHSKEVNFTTAETQSGSEDVPNEIQCTNEDLTALRVYCIRESLSENIVEKPYFDIARALPSSSIHNQGVCDWIGRRFQELERSEITDSATAFNCASI